MILNKKSLSVRFVSLLLVALTFGSTFLPASIAIAEDVPVEAPPVVEEPQTLPPETVIQESAPDVQEQTLPSNDPANESAGESGTDGADGAPQDPPPAEGGANGDNATDTTPATDGEAGDSGSTDSPQDATNEGQDGEGSVINTGDASSDATGVTDANNTNVDVHGPTGSTDESSTNDGSSETPTEVTIDLENDLLANNGAESDAQSGQNTAIDPDGVQITTGDADAYGYLISLFNIAITNSSGSILFLRNPLGDALNLKERIMNVFLNITGENGVCSFVSCSLVDAIINFFSGNNADVTNSLVVRSGTGENSGQSDAGDVLIETGNARSFGSIVNFGNLQIIDSRYMVILMANEGDLAGDVILPEPEFFQELSSGAAIARGSDVSFTNDIDIENYGTSTADSGDNASTGDEGALVQSGNARATSAEMNFLNQMGSPICFVVTLGGEWDGKVQNLPEGFSEEKTPFGEIICGRGGSQRDSHTQVNGETTNYAHILNQAIVEAVSGKNIADGVQAAIKSGNSDAFLQILNVVNQQIIGQDWIFALFSISGDWNGDLVFGSVPNDDNPLNEVAAQLLASAAVGSSGNGGGSPGGYTSTAKLEITKTASVNETSTPASIDYTVTVKNVSGQGAVYRAKLSDMMQDKEGNVKYARTWNLKTIEDGETITLTYTVEFGDGYEPGDYTNTARVIGYLNSSIYVYPLPIQETVASATVTIVDGDDTQQTVAVEAPKQCVPLLRSYIRAGAENNDPTDVRNLQQFLHDVENEQIDSNGIYDFITIAAVKRFQMKYSSEVLAPWGISEPTGHVYYTTQRKINDLSCVGGDTFPLTNDQIHEIDSFHRRVSQVPPAANPATEVVGSVETDLQNALSVGPSPVGAKVLLKALTPVSTDQSAQSAENNHSSQTLNILKSFSWVKKFLPFVEALEL